MIILILLTYCDYVNIITVVETFLPNGLFGGKVSTTPVSCGNSFHVINSSL
jgi:hypothetical protein